MEYLLFEGILALTTAVLVSDYLGLEERLGVIKAEMVRSPNSISNLLLRSNDARILFLSGPLGDIAYHNHRLQRS